MLKKIFVGFRMVFKLKYLVLCLYAIATVVVNALVGSLLTGFLLIILYLVALPWIIYLYFSDYSDSFKKIVYVFFVLVFVHVCLWVNAAYINQDIHREKPQTSELSYTTFISDEDNIVFFDKPYFYSGIYVCSTDFSEGKVLDCSLREGKAELLCSKIYKDVEGSDFSFAVTYYPESIQGLSKFTLTFKLVDSEEKEPGWLTYVLYGRNDYYMSVNQKIGEKIFATYIVNPQEKEWKTLKVDSIINDYNAVATRLEGKLWDELNVKKIRVGINSFSDKGGTMSLYLKGLEVKKKKN